MEHEKKERSSFSGGIGFVLAAAGSAVGRGNLPEKMERDKYVG